jgi:hypothetical protein
MDPEDIMIMQHDIEDSANQCYAEADNDPDDEKAFKLRIVHFLLTKAAELLGEIR